MKKLVKPAVQTAFFDFGNVVVRYDVEIFFNTFGAHTGIPRHILKEALFGPEQGYSPLWAEFESGRITPPKFFHELTTLLQCTDRIDFETFARSWVSIFTDENPGFEELLRRVVVEKFLLSNTNVIAHARYIAHHPTIKRHFPLAVKRIMSYHTGTLKPDPEIYRQALAIANATPESSVFVDDKAENVAAWVALGGHGIRYDARFDPIEYLEEELALVGVLA